jgi:single-stranded DNA-binding protein
MPDGRRTATISLATTEVWKDKQNGAKKEKTEWHRIVFFKRIMWWVSIWINGRKLCGREDENPNVER